MAKEINANEVIQFVGVSELSPEEQKSVQDISTHYYPKIKRAAKNITSLAVHVKTHGSDGPTKRYSMTVRCIMPSKTFESNRHEDFDLNKACHQAFESILHEIHHAFHSDVSGVPRR